MPRLHFTPLYPEHLLYLTPHPVQEDEYKALLSPAGVPILEASTGVTAWSGVKCVGMGGIVQHWPGRAEVWGLLSADAKDYILAVFNKVRLMLDSHPSRRLEMNVRADNNAGLKLARHLGFEREGVLRSYWMDGADVVVFSRIKEATRP